MSTERQQAILFLLGHYSLRRKDGTIAIDGIPGPATTAGTKAVQRRLDLPETGIWDEKTDLFSRRLIGQQEAEKPKYKWVDPEDFRCRCGGQFCDGWPAQPSKKLLDLLEQIGEHFQRRIRPHSGLRCKRWNAKWGGAWNSQHLTGHAMDFHLDGVSPQELYDYCDQLLGNSGGLGIYDWGVHMDDRAGKSRWRG